MELKIVKLDGISYDSMKEYEVLLPEYRREKIARFKNDSDKLRSLAAGLLIRSAVGDSEIAFNEHGKPYAKDSDARFSVSHSGERVILSVDRNDTGADVEQLVQKDYLNLAKRFFHPNELEYVMTEVNETSAFFEIWTRKEAYLKMLGAGISTVELSSFDTLSDELRPRMYTSYRKGYYMTVCSTDVISADDLYTYEVDIHDLI